MLLRGFSGVERQRGGVSAAEQSLCAAEQREAAARVCGEAAGCGLGYLGVDRVFKKARARGFGRACPGRDLGEICGGFR